MISPFSGFDDGQSVRLGLEHYALTTGRKENPGSRPNTKGSTTTNDICQTPSMLSISLRAMSCLNLGLVRCGAANEPLSFTHGLAGLRR